MIGKTMMTAAFALALTTPALAQTTTAPSSDASQSTMPQTDPNQTSGTMSSGQSNGMMNSGNGMGKMSKSDMSAMKRCQAMSSDAMAKNKKCSMLMQKYPNAGSSTGSM